MKYILSFTLNGAPVDAVVKATDTLLDVLREKIGMTGTKRGCDTGNCGACTVLINNEPVNACLTIALTVADKEVVSVEGLSEGSELHPLQKAFHEHGASQCGFCTSGMLVAAKALLDKHPDPTRSAIVEFMSGNLCRCGTYLEVIEAIQAVAGGK
jgi:carbon-monoxide dehydrogenase small subunit